MAGCCDVSAVGGLLVMVNSTWGAIQCDCCVQNTMNFHYGKHHMAYVTNMNKQIEGTDLDNKPLEEVRPQPPCAAPFALATGAVLPQTPSAVLSDILLNPFIYTQSKCDAVRLKPVMLWVAVCAFCG